MGAGHDAVAGELARRLRATGHQVLVRDVLTLLPPGAGPAVRSFYRFSVRHAPAVYEAIYALFLEPAGGRARAGRSGTAPHRPDVSPLAALAERRLAALVAGWRPDVVVSTFHLAGQITGRLRAAGRLRVPSAVFVTDFAVHRAWLDPGNDLYLCVTETAAEAVRAATGRPAAAPGPVVPPEFHPPLGAARPSWTTGPPAVLLSAGAWGVGPGLPDTAGRLAAHGCRPVVLCGHDRRLRARAARLPGVVALGWVRDMPGLLASVRLLVDNAAGQTAVQALAARLPVIGHRPLVGHGAAGVRAMAEAGLCVFAPRPADLLAAVDRLAPPGTARTAAVSAGAGVFRADAARLVVELAGE
ncbi:galactosyldiacylglycerol synthase [Streptomyces sp. LP05-1]|uniref:Galactosyldiacylglycerol synthase n=1 Tax=Streptomyces pyxinae TaxID=2970734 RepID=A0ABT2CCS8_9ACTN|nr:galactosyldiacylglycerol synthase [Streptomyces sp. LP05-1]MCS0634922.1 galactosyldiacylglycerol synthase [Streptomyces sp. LP05-1]